MSKKDVSLWDKNVPQEPSLWDREDDIMANIFDYLQWRGDLTLEQDEFNEIDNLILARFSYLPFDELIKENVFDISKINILEVLREQKEMKLKGNLYTRIKKHMTKKMYHLYYRENREASQSKEEYEANLLRAYRHLDACRFKNKGWPCPTCPSCCFCGKDYETMTEVMDFAREWMKENPDKARFMKPPKFLHKH